MELIGTFALCFVGGMAVMSKPVNADADQVNLIALAHGFVLAFMIYAGANVSGAHYNPAVSVGLLITCKCPMLDALLYIPSQLVGSILAGLLVAVISSDDVLKNAGWTIDEKLNRCGCPAGPGLANQALYAGLCELLATFFLMFVIMGTAVDKRAPKGVYGIAIGLTLSMCIIGLVEMSGGALNPWRSIGPQIGAAILYPKPGWETFGKSFWIYLFPFAGAALAAFLYEFLFNVKEKPAPAKDNTAVELEVQSDNVGKI